MREAMVCFIRMGSGTSMSRLIGNVYNLIQLEQQSTRHLLYSAL